MSGATDLDTGSPVWRALERRMNSRRDEMVAECIAVGTPAERRAELAARIAAFDEVLAMPEAARRTISMAGPTEQPRIY